MTLSVAADIDRILHHKAPQRRAAIAATLGEQLNADLPALEREIAEEVTRRLAKDATQLVRQALALSVRNSPFLPKDIGLSIAYDVSDVAAPFLETTEIFSTEELCDIARRVAQASKGAIARRDNLQAAVACVLSECGDSSVALTLAQNQSAELRTDTLINLVRNFDGETTLFEAMAARGHLPLPIAQVLLARVGDAARQALTERYDFPEDINTPLVEETRLRSILTLSESAGALDLMALLRDLREEGKLLPATLVWALRANGIRFFEAACALQAGRSLSETSLIVREGRTREFGQLLAKAKIPQAMWGDIRFQVDRILKGSQNGLAPRRVKKKAAAKASARAS